MEHGSIERELHIDASPEVVYDVVSSPEHIREWWGADSDFDAVTGGVGELVWGDETTPRAHVTPFTVMEADPPRRFAFRWIVDPAIPDKTLLVTFELAPAGEGTTLRLTETGFREMGWEAAVLEAQYQEHVQGWDLHLGHLAEYLTKLVSP
jgi:uncharacterized protein YndB with AHSA1/START domain